MHKCYHFCYEERVKIQLLVKEGDSLRRIAKTLDRSPSSISREMLSNQGKKPIELLKQARFRMSAT